MSEPDITSMGKNTKEVTSCPDLREQIAINGACTCSVNGAHLYSALAVRTCSAHMHVHISLGPRPTLQHWIYVSHHQHARTGGSGTLLSSGLSDFRAVLIVLW